MKNLRTYLVMGAMAIACSASAQFVNSGSSSSVRSISSVNTNGWERFYVEYNPTKLKIDVKNADDFDFKGLTFGYMKGISITNKIPLFVEAGAGLQFRTYKDESDEFELLDDGSTFFQKYRVNLFSINIPVNLVYKWQINDKLSLSPYFGLDFRINVVGKEKVDVEFDWGTQETASIEDELRETLEEEGYIYDSNLFDKDDMGKDGKWKRFQAGWHIGANLDYNHFNVGIGYGSDFNEVFDKAKFSTTSIRVGYNF